MITKGRFLIIIVLLVIIFILFGNSSGYSSEVRGVTDTKIKVGTIGDLTGPIATIWQAALQALRNYYKNVNENGGIHGRMVVNIVEDDRYTIPMALSAFKKLIFRDQVLLLFAASGVGHTHAIVPLAGKNKVPMIAQTNDRKYFNPVKKYIFTALPFYEDQLELIFEYIHNDLKIKKPRIILAYPDTAAGNISRDLCKKLVKYYNVKKYSETIISVGAGDFTSQVLSMKSSKPDVVIIHGYIGSTSALLRDAYKFRFKSNFFAVQYACIDDTVKLAGVAAQGLLGTNGFCSWNDEGAGMIEVRRIANKYNPDTKLKNRNYLNGWLAAMLIHKALNNSGRELTPESVVRGFEKINNFDTEGICGIVTYGLKDHKSIDYSRFYKADVKLKQFVAITGWRKPSFKDLARSK